MGGRSDYELLELIGRGASGSVYLARHAPTGRLVAVKHLHVERTTPEAVARFRREEAAMASVAHPGVVAIEELMNIDGSVMLVMEYVDGATLQALLGVIDGALALAVIGQLGDPLDAVHRAGIVHRDLKPANILVDRSGRGLLADFGIARFVGESVHTPGRNVIRTRSGVIVGTPAYIAPEVAEGARTIDSRADIYSLGVIAYQVLVGMLPFRGRPYDLLAAHISAPVPPPRTLVKDFPARTEAVLLRALAKAPDERFASAGAFVVALLESTAAAWPVTPRSVLAACVADVADQRVRAPSEGPTVTAAPPAFVAPRVLPPATDVPVWAPPSRRPRRVAALVALAIAAGAVGALAVLLLHP